MARRLIAETLGTAGLLIAIVGSGMRGDGPQSSQLFQHAIVVGAALAALIATFLAVSGAHFNPAVTLVDALVGGMPWGTALAYIPAQVLGAGLGVVGGNLLSGLPAVAMSTTSRTGLRVAASEAVATLVLLLVIFALKRSGKVAAIPAAVGAWIAAAIYFTPSTSFANPAVTIARAFTDSPTGIATSDLGGVLLGQLVAVMVGVGIISWLFTDGALMKSKHSIASRTEEQNDR